MRIKALYRYDETGHANQAQALNLERTGIVGNRVCHHWRQLLLLPFAILERFQLSPTNLKENLLIEGNNDIHDLPSGTVIRMGEAQIRLTFHCEPCAKISHWISPRTILHQRGYLAQVIHPGTIAQGDTLDILERRFDPIPHTAGERIRWYLENLEEPVMAAQLVDLLGLPKSYCRALPGLLRRHPELDRGLIKFASRQKASDKPL